MSSSLLAIGVYVCRQVRKYDIAITRLQLALRVAQFSNHWRGAATDEVINRNRLQWNAKYRTQRMIFKCFPKHVVEKSSAVGFRASDQWSVGLSLSYTSVWLLVYLAIPAVRVNQSVRQLANERVTVCTERVLMAMKKYWCIDWLIDLLTHRCSLKLSSVSSALVGCSRVNRIIDFGLANISLIGVQLFCSRPAAIVVKLDVHFASVSLVTQLHCALPAQVSDVRTTPRRGLPHPGALYRRQHLLRKWFPYHRSRTTNCAVTLPKEVLPSGWQVVNWKLQRQCGQQVSEDISFIGRSPTISEKEPEPCITRTTPPRNDRSHTTVRIQAFTDGYSSS